MNSVKRNNHLIRRFPIALFALNVNGLAKLIFQSEDNATLHRQMKGSLSGRFNGSLLQRKKLDENPIICLAWIFWLNRQNFH